MTLSFILGELRGKLRRKSRPEIEVEARRNAKLYERRRHLYLHTTDSAMKRAEFADLQHCILLRDRLVTNVVIRATECFNLQCNNVARQVEEKRCPYDRTLKIKGTLKNSSFNCTVYLKNGCC